MESYTGFAEFYDLFMDNIPYKDWSKYLIGLLNEYGIKDGIVLDMGCGTGNITELLAVAGYDMIGIDNSEDMLGEAMEKLNSRGLSEVIREAVRRKIPLLGICLGLQLLFESSEESPGVEGLAVLKGKIKINFKDMFKRNNKNTVEIVDSIAKVKEDK